MKPRGGSSQSSALLLLAALLAATAVPAAFSCRPSEREEVWDRPPHTPTPDVPAPERVLFRHRFEEGEDTGWRFLFLAFERVEDAPVRIFGSGKGTTRIVGRAPDRGWEAVSELDNFRLTVLRTLRGEKLALFVDRDAAAAWWGGRRLPLGGEAGRALEEDLRGRLEAGFLFDERGDYSQPDPEEKGSFPLSSIPFGLFFPETSVEPGDSWRSSRQHGVPVTATFAGYTSYAGGRPAVIEQEGAGDGFRFNSRHLFDIEKGRVLRGYFYWEADPGLPGYSGPGLIMQTGWTLIPKEAEE